MENSCFICEKHKPWKSLTELNDDDLSIRDTINETFSIKFDESQLSRLKICKGCNHELSTCHNFYQRVKNAQNRLAGDSECDVNALVKVEIKQEPDQEDESHFDSQEFDFFQSFDANSSDKLEFTEVRRKRVKKIDNHPRKYQKLSEDDRKSRGNRGIRRAKEAIKITTAYLYESELKGTYIEPPEELQTSPEDRLKKGLVSERVTAALSAGSWPSAFEWKCTEASCAQSFSNILDLDKHLHKVHRIKYRTNCGLCLKATQNYAAFLNHIIDQHAPNNKFCCIVCPQPFFMWNFKDLYLHYLKVHKLKNLNFCLYCGLHFHCGARLKEHLIQKHHKENDRAEQFECDFCGFKTEQRSRIKSHMVRHVVPTHLCYLCSATFTDSGYLSTHLRQVHSELQIQCTQCDKVFKTNKRLRCHFQTVHEEKKPFLCEICNKRFAARHRLNIHLRIHRDQREENYQCSYCERRFKYKPGMLYHERAAHTGEQPYKCPIDGCFERFYDFSNAKKHISGRHNSMLRPILENL